MATYANEPRANRRVPDACRFLERPQRFHHANDGGFAGRVERVGEHVGIPGDTGNPEDVAAAAFAFLPCVVIVVVPPAFLLQPMIQRDLGQPDGPDGVDTENPVQALFLVGGVAGQGAAARRVPEAAARVDDAGAVDDDVDRPEGA